MLPYFLLGIALLVGLLLISKWFSTVDPKILVKALKVTAFLVLAVSAAFLALTGRLGWALGVGAALLPWLMAFARGARTAKNYARMSGGGGGQTSTVTTRFFRMSLNHDTGELDGEVMEGPYSGRVLSAMSLAELLDLLGQCRTSDEQSRQVLEAYLDRVHSGWRDTQEHAESDSDAHGTVQADMTRKQAYEILGLEPGASESEIKAAYHRLIATLHPDKGGSNFLAAKVNQAKELLLGH